MSVSLFGVIGHLLSSDEDAASIASHRLRAEMLGKQAIGNLTTMLLHEEAASMIEASGVQCLGQTARAVAA